MEWALIDRVHYDDDTTRDDASQAAQSVLARLPADCHEEFLSMLREACSESARRRLCITQSDQPMLMVDILPLRPGGEGEWPALVVLALFLGFLVFAWGFNDLNRQDNVMQTMAASFLAVVVLLLWFLLASRAPWKWRLGALALALIGSVVAVRFLTITGVDSTFLAVRAAIRQIVLCFS